MTTPPDPDEAELVRTRLVTRSGRSVRPPVRYEPDSDQIMEDDFSDVSSDDEWGYGERALEADDESSGELAGFESDSQDSSYVSTSDTVSDDESFDEQDEDSDFFGETESEDELAGEDADDIIEWETLTADASDECVSDDDQDL